MKCSRALQSVVVLVVDRYPYGPATVDAALTQNQQLNSTIQPVQIIMILPLHVTYPVLVYLLFSYHR